MKKVLFILVMLVCISCSPKTDVTNTVVAKNGNNSVVDEIYGLDEVSYTQYAEYVDKAKGSSPDNSNIADSNIAPSNIGDSNTSSNAYNSKTDDMILIYYGNKKRLKWGKSELEKVVMHTFQDGHKDWFFPSFLYLEFKNDMSLRFGDNQPGDEPANKESWEWLLNRYFSTAYNDGNYEGLKALDECIESCKKRLGEPRFKHKVVLTVPSPCTNYTEWGSIKVNGRTIKLDFRNTSHKLEAVKWYINELVTRFKAQHYKNITLEGLYWGEENTTMTSWHKEKKSGKWTNKIGDKFDYVFDTNAKRHNDIVVSIGNYIHSIKGLKFYWIPYWNAYGSENKRWKNILGFDRCDIQTGYFWGTPDLLRGSKPFRTISDLRRICDAVIDDGKGLEFEVSADLFVPCYGKLKNKRDVERPYDIVKVDGCKKTQKEMKAMGYTRFNYNPCLLARFRNLMDVFEDQGVFNRANISYYFDNSAILDLCNSRDNEIIELVDRLARHISRRNKNK